MLALSQGAKGQGGAAPSPWPSPEMGEGIKRAHAMCRYVRGVCHTGTCREAVSSPLILAFSRRAKGQINWAR